MLHRKLGEPNKTVRKTEILKNVFLALVRLCYNTFVLVQLGCIGYAESYRVRHMISIMLSNVRQIRVVRQPLSEAIIVQPRSM